MEKFERSTTWKSNKRKPRVGGLYYVVQNLDDGRYPVSWCAHFNAGKVGKRGWFHDMFEKEEIPDEQIMFWASPIRPPKGIKYSKGNY